MKPRPAIRLKDSTCWPADGIPGLTGDEVCLVLTKGCVSLVDAEDAIDLQQHNWCAGPRPRRLTAGRWSRNGRTIYLHREIMRPPKDTGIDHIDQHRFFGFGIVDNRRANLRIVTKSQNGANSRKNPKRSSIYKGVYWQTQVKKWHVQIELNGRKKYLGLFSNEIDAANAYDAAHTLNHPSIPEGTNAHMMNQTPTTQAAAV